MSEKQLEPLSVSQLKLYKSKNLASRGMIWELNTCWKIEGLEIEYYRSGSAEGQGVGRQKERQVQ
jgi:hypothetical protein